MLQRPDRRIGVLGGVEAAGKKAIFKLAHGSVMFTTMMSHIACP